VSSRSRCRAGKELGVARCSLRVRVGALCGSQPGAMLGESRRCGQVGPGQVIHRCALGGELIQDVAPTCYQTGLIGVRRHDERGTGHPQRGGHRVARDVVHRAQALSAPPGQIEK
jgi:hypothetical protein